MKINKNLISDFSDSLKKKSFRFGFDADKDWVIVCLATAVFIVGIGIWSTIIYISYNQSINSQRDSEDSVPKSALINQNQLDLVFEKYQQKKENFEKFQSAAPDITDPGV